MTEPDPADLDAIMAALMQLRGRGRGPGGFGPGRPGGFGQAGSDGPGSSGGRGGPMGPGGPRGRGPWGGGGHHGGPHGAQHDGPAPGPRLGGPARLRLLDALAAASHALSVSEVGEAIGVDQPRASRLIQQAVDLGLVRREADPDDARRTRVALTDEGARLARGFRGQRREHLTQALAGFTADERTELARLLTKLAAGWPQH